MEIGTVLYDDICDLCKQRKLCLWLVQPGTVAGLCSDCIDTLRIRYDKAKKDNT